MSEESILLFFGASTKKTATKEEPKVLVPPPDVLNEIDSRQTNDPERGDTWRTYKQTSNISFKTFEMTRCVSKQISSTLLSQDHTFVTIGETELAKMDIPIVCRMHLASKQRNTPILVLYWKSL